MRYMRDIDHSNQCPDQRDSFQNWGVEKETKSLSTLFYDGFWVGIVITRERGSKIIRTTSMSSPPPLNNQGNGAPKVAQGKSTERM